MSAKLGWCLTGHHADCWHTVGGDHPNYPLITCGCPCHQENE